MPRNRLRDLIAPRLHNLERRVFLKQTAGAAAAVAALEARVLRAAPLSTGLDFAAVPHGVDETHHVPPGYRARVLLRWGDPLFRNAPPFAPGAADAAAQRRQFGYNNDFIAFFPGDDSDAGVLCVNHEYVNTNFLFPGITRENVMSAMNPERTAVEMAACGLSVVGVRRRAGAWEVDLDHTCNRRVTAATPCRLSGPAAGSDRLRTRADPEGAQVLGVLGPCGGGKTPWGTVLSAEENFHSYFTGKPTGAERRNHARYGVGAGASLAWWAAADPRFDVAREPREPNRFGWVVEIDPRAPDAPPVKRTALGRCKHEAATVVVNRDGRVVVYTGDDEVFEYLYRFVSDGTFRPGDADHNRDLLDAGTLSVARFEEDGTLRWLPLVHGTGPLTRANGFESQADVLIEARRAADLLGATALDRPEDVETRPQDGVVYVMLTNNVARRETDAANPRAANPFGHILTLAPPGAGGADPAREADHAAPEYRWDIALLAGDPDDPASGARYPADPGATGWFAAPDNCAFDPAGRLWVATDQGNAWGRTGIADGLWACALAGGRIERIKRFFRAPVGAEVCGPEFTPDGRTLFLAVQHPGVDGIPGASFATPGTRWPDFRDDVPPRPSVLAITREDGGVIGG